MPDLRILTNIANPYNGALYDELNDVGCVTEVLYKSTPANEGRTWIVEGRPYERVTSPLCDMTSLMKQPAVNTILTGGYHGGRDVLRLTLGALTKTRLSFWGERLQLSKHSAIIRMVPLVLFRQMSCVFAVGSWARDSYREVVADRTPIHIFPYGLPAATASPSRADEPVIGFAGSLNRRKGVDILLAGLGALPGRRPRLEVIGSGPERRTLGLLSDRLGLDVSWHEEVSTERLNELRSRWWTQVVPSRYDGWGMVVPEALAAGIPVIATDHVGAALDLVINQVTGELVRSPDGLVGALRRLLEPDYQAQLSAGARTLGRELVADRAAPWLAAILNDRPPTGESFVADALSAAGIAKSRPK